ncbi:MAG: thioredoxin [Hyphomicrobiales bacterium]
MDKPFMSMGSASTMAGPAPAAAGDLVKESSTRTFMADVIETSRQVPVIVDFWAPWCGPCKQLGPALEKVVREAKGAVRMVKINVDENQQLAAQMRIQSIPAVFAFVDGQPVDGFMGALPDAELKKFVARLAKSGIGAQIEEVLAEADGLLAAGDAENAAKAYAEVLGADRENARAIAGLARCQIASGDLEGTKVTIGLAQGALANDPAIAGARAALELAANPVDLSEVTRLTEAVEKDPADLQARFDLAMALNAANRRDEALDHLLTIVRKKRDWNDDGARKQLVKLFEAWGPKDELTVAGRKKLSSILFS